MHPSYKYQHPTHAVIDLDAFRFNVESIRSSLSHGVKILAIVKADAYGHGVELITAEGRRAGIDQYGVARAKEGYELRKEGVKEPILVFDLIPRDEVKPCLATDLQLNVATLEGASIISGEAAKMKTKARVHVEVDTGMGRLGFPWSDAADEISRIARLPWVELVGVFSHFATAESPDQTYARTQIERFEQVLSRLQTLKVEFPLRHMANSGAVACFPEAHYDMVRPGILLYGYPPRPDMNLPFPLRHVLSLKSRVLFLKTVEPGTGISYGRRFVAAQKTTIATIPIGYGDGYARSLTGSASVLIRGHRYPVVGTICMDQIMVDVGTEGVVEVGDDVTLIGKDGSEEITCWDLAKTIGTIPYEITTLISPRVARVGVSHPSAKSELQHARK